MNNNESRAADQAELRRRLGIQRKSFKRYWLRDAQAVLGLAPSAHRIIYTLASESSTGTPFEWTQQWTQEEWARNWNVPERSFRRSLKDLREARILLREGTGHRGTRYVIHPTVVTAFARQEYGQLGSFCRKSAEENPAIWYGKSGHFDPPTSGGKSSPNEYLTTVEPSVTKDLGYSESFRTRPRAGRSISNRSSKGKSDPVGLVPVEPGDGAAAACNPEGNEMARWNPDHDDVPVVLGKDPSSPPPAPASGRRSPTTVVLDTFQREWEAARRESNLGPEYPLRVWSVGRTGKPAASGWISNTFLPSLDGDVELACALVALFARLVAQGRPGFGYDPRRNGHPLWSHLSKRQGKALAELRSQGWRPEAEVLAADQERQELAESSRRRSEERALKARERADQLVTSVEGKPFGAETQAWMEFSQTSDYLDWVDVDDGETLQEFAERHARRGKRYPRS